MSDIRSGYEVLGWPPFSNAIEGVDRVGSRLRAGSGVTVFRAANANRGAGIFLGDDVWLFDRVRLLLGDADTRLTIGNRVAVNCDSYLSGEGGLEIGDDVLLGTRVLLLSAGHVIHDGDLLISRNPIEAAPIKIGRGAWVGAGAIVLPGVVVGEGAVVGAGSVVTKNVPDLGVVAGNPARLLHYRRMSDRKPSVDLGARLARLIRRLTSRGQ